MGQEIKEQTASPETRHNVIAVTPSQEEVMEALQPTPTTFPVRRTFMMPRHLLDKPWGLVAACIQAFVMVACLWAGPASANEDEDEDEIKVQGRFAYVVNTGGRPYKIGDKEYPDASAVCTAYFDTPEDTPEGLKAASPPDEQGQVRCQGTEGFDMHLDLYVLLCPANTWPRIQSAHPTSDPHRCECDHDFVARGGTACVPREEAAAEGAKGAQNESGGGDDGNPQVAGDSVLNKLATNIHRGQQGKHIPGDRNFIPGRSSINSNVDPQQLLNGVHSGQHPIVGTGSRGQPIADFGRPIGVDAATGLPTQYGIIHSGKNGAHIVPTDRMTIKGNK